MTAESGMDMHDKGIIPPGSVIGILGGGQLGRMLAIAAARLGYRCRIFAPEANPPAAQVANSHHCAAYEDEKALSAFAAQVDAITLEFENIPTETIEFLARYKPVRPGAHLLSVSQDRLREKEAINALGIATAPFQPVNSLEELQNALEIIGMPSILKTRRFGYDGKGQAAIRNEDDIIPAWQAMAEAPAILEGFVDFICEISVIVARNSHGDIAIHGPMENRHHNHILDVTIAPASIESALAEAARMLGRQLATGLDLIGLMTAELFVSAEGRLLVNEIAPRTHNSGHFTIEACHTSQFEQAIRALCGLPLGDTGQHTRAIMKNLIGDDAKLWREILSDGRAHLHLYGKEEARPGRKMGHVTWLYPDTGNDNGSKMPWPPAQLPQIPQTFTE